jgi:aldehyde dehydrogenase (NAD+)
VDDGPVIDPEVAGTAVSAEVERVRRWAAAGSGAALETRLSQLDGLARLLRERHAAILDALAADLGKPGPEAELTEIGVVGAEVRHLKKILPAFLRPESRPMPWQLQPSSARLVPQPVGVVAVIAPWNYPLQLSVSPLAGAVAAGNAVVLKPSELAPATADLLAEQLPRYLDPASVAVVRGGAEVATALLATPLDHIVYTGGERVGRIVAHAAAEQLTPVTLELGGKSPAYVDATADVAVAARRLAWAAFLNAGQTCTRPDHVLVHAGVAAQFTAALVAAVADMFGADPLTSTSLGSLVDSPHTERVAKLLAGHGGRVLCGGQVDVAGRRVAPTVVLDPDPASALLTEEIFAPVLPVITVADVGAACRWIAARPAPLAVYVFTADDDVTQQVLTRTRSGSLVVNHATVQTGAPGLPFGGVGASGFGAYHGLDSLRLFSHLRPVVTTRTRPDLPLLYPPYTAAKKRLVRLLSR